MTSAPSEPARRVEPGVRPGPAGMADVAVVGAGPAGMAAAAEAAAAGCRVTVVDSYPSTGGPYHRGPAPGLDIGGPPAAAPDRAFARQVADGRVRVLTGATVWTAEAGDGTAFTLHLTSSAGAPQPQPTALRARTVVLATGATDRVLPFPGWDLPGVVTAGGAQALLKGQGVLVGDRVVVAGSGPFLLPVAAALVRAGGAVAAVAEAQGPRALARAGALRPSHRGKVLEAAGYLAALARAGVPVRLGSAVTAARGEGRVEEVTLSRLGPDWAPVPGHERTLPVDAVCVSFGFVPQVGLARLLGCELGADRVWGDPAVIVGEQQATTVAGVFAAGEATGVAGADAAAVEGAVAGLAAAAALGRLDLRREGARLAGLLRARRRQRRFAGLLGELFQVRPGWQGWLRADTLLCRCEEVPHAAVLGAITDLGASDLRSVKLTTRCGMGYCQGRMCGDAVAAVVARATGAPPADAGALSTPSILVPVPLARLAALDDGGDRSEDLARPDDATGAGGATPRAAEGVSGAGDGEGDPRPEDEEPT